MPIFSRIGTIRFHSLRASPVSHCGMAGLLYSMLAGFRLFARQEPLSFNTGVGVGLGPGLLTLKS
jgi:hypothetical protein